jgi:nitrate reductase beta subunit
MKKVDWLDQPLAQKEGRTMKVRAQIGMVLNLDKCIGCHTCSVTCKNVWTSREGVEYAWFNNVETKPGIGYPRDWENQKRWNGGWRRTNGGKLEPRWAQVAHPRQDICQPRSARDRRLLRAVRFRLRPSADRSGDAGVSHRAAALEDQWRADGEDRVGSELGRDSRRRVRQALEGRQFRERAEGIYGQFEHTFMMYLPRLCEHCLNPTCVAACPSGAIYKREEDGIVLIDQDKCRGWRMCVYRPARTRRSITTGRAANPRSARSAIRASSGPADGVLGDLCRPHPLSWASFSTTPIALRPRQRSR